jgi:excisionase family DNA binding protein
MSATLTAHRLRAHTTTDDGQEPRVSRRAVPLFIKVDEAAVLLRTTRRAIYAMVERRQLPGVVRLRRRVLFRSDVLLDWLHQKVRAIAEGVRR